MVKLPRIARPADRAFRVALTVLALVAGASAATAAEKTAPATLDDLARAYENARQSTGPDRTTEMEHLLHALDSADTGDRWTGARADLLRGRIALDLGQSAVAEDALKRAVKGTSKTPFQDDAAFALIEAIEAQGRTDEAEKEWKGWLKRYGDGPLAAEAELRRAWNDLRRGDLDAAGNHLTDLMKRWPWMSGDPRVTLTGAMWRTLRDEPKEALALLGPDPGTTPGRYLAAICLRRTGERLRAAAMFQQVADSDPSSPLRDPALLAKADVFLEAGDFRSAAESFDRVAHRVSTPAVRAEAELRAAGSRFLAGESDSALVRLRQVAARYDGTDVAARAQFLVGEALVSLGRTEDAIAAYNQVLTRYFQQTVAASAQYRVARCLDALGRSADATSSYQAVVRGYPLEPEAPAAAYLAGVGLLGQGRPQAAVPYFQLVLDRYAARRDEKGAVVFARPEHAELVDASLCMMFWAYQQAGQLGQLSGAPLALLDKLPPSRSLWRAHALLFGADALASQGRLDDARRWADELSRAYPDRPVGARASRLLAWVYARQGNDSLAVATEEKMLARLGPSGDSETVSAALLDIAHERFNQKRYRDAAGAYEEFLKRFPGHPGRLPALYQAGLCYLRLDRAGDALDRWEAIVRDSASAPLAERAWARIGDLYFQAERYDDARRAYRGLLEHFASTPAAGLAALRIAQSDYNAGHDQDAVTGFSAVMEKHPDTPYAREAERGLERALYRLGQRPDGEKVLATLVDKYPGSPFAADAQFQIARKEYEAKQWAGAADAFRRVVSQFPGYSAADQAQFLMADAYDKAGVQDEARRGWEQFLAYFPNSELAPTVRFRLGLARFAAHEYLEAAVAFQGAAADSLPSDVRSAALYNLALCHRQLGDLDAARTELERHHEQFPNDKRAVQVAYQLGDLAEATGDPARAEAEYARALTLSPDPALSVELAFRLGHSREAQGNVDGAIEAYGRAVRAPDKDQPYRLSALARLAALHESRKEFAQALEAYRDIVKHARDQQLVAAASDRASQLEVATGRRKR